MRVENGRGGSGDPSGGGRVVLTAAERCPPKRVGGEQPENHPDMAVDEGTARWSGGRVVMNSCPWHERSVPGSRRVLQGKHQSMHRGPQ